MFRCVPLASRWSQNFLCPCRLCLPGQRKAPLVQRGDSMAGPCRGDCEADCVILLGCMIGCGSTAWVQCHTLSIPQSAFADSSLCTREVRWPDGHTVFAGLHRTSLLCGTGPGSQSSPYRVMVYHTRSTGAEQCTKPSASFGCSVTLVPCRDGPSAWAPMLRSRAGQSKHEKGKASRTGRLFPCFWPGLQSGPYRVMVYHTRSTGV